MVSYAAQPSLIKRDRKSAPIRVNDSRLIHPENMYTIYIVHLQTIIAIIWLKTRRRVLIETRVLFASNIDRNSFKTASDFAPPSNLVIPYDAPNQ